MFFSFSSISDNSIPNARWHQNTSILYAYYISLSFILQTLIRFIDHVLR
jgi:hypothetical protein